jgi:glycosyltransferase involved in cell wall biosynthesis
MSPTDEEPESRPLHVCHVVERLSLGAAARLIPACNGLDTDEFLVSCLSLSTRDRLVLEELEPRVQTWGLAFVPRSSLSGSLVELFRRFRVDVVHTHGAATLQTVAPAAHMAGVRAIIHTGYGEREPLPSGAITLTAASVPAARMMAEAHGRELAEIEVLPTGVDTERFRPPLDREALRERLGLDPATLVVGSVSLATEARLSLPVLISTLRGRGVQATGLLVGGEANEGSPHDPLLLETGPTRDVASRLAAMDLLVVETGQGTTVAPISLLEGMASGLPVVVSRSPGVLDVCGEEGAAIVTDGRFEDEVERLARDPDLRRDLGEKARRFAEREFRRSTVIDAYANVYRSLGLADGT